MGACGHSSTVCGYSTISSLAGLVLRALLRINLNIISFIIGFPGDLILGYTREVIFRLRQKTAKTVGQRPQNLYLVIYWVLKPSLTHSIIKILITQDQ